MEDKIHKYSGNKLFSAVGGCFSTGEQQLAFLVPSTRIMKGRAAGPDVCGRQQGHGAKEAILGTFPGP